MMAGTDTTGQLFDAQLAELVDALGYRFKQPGLLLRALTHRSFSADHNERLEFLGDSVLGLSVASLLFQRLPHASEGELSRVRANLVNQDSLHRLAHRLGLSAYIRLGAGELRSGGRQRPSILADAFEAVIGAVYLDAGYVAAEQLVHRLFADVSLDAAAIVLRKDAKTALQEWLQARGIAVPVYTVQAVQGAAHQQSFEVMCQIDALGVTQLGQGTSRRAAEQAAAAQVLAAMADTGKAHRADVNGLVAGAGAMDAGTIQPAKDKHMTRTKTSPRQSKRGRIVQHGAARTARPGKT